MSKIKTLSFLLLGSFVFTRFMLDNGLNYLVSAAPVTVQQIYSDTTTTMASLFSTPGFMLEGALALLLAAGLMVKVVHRKP